MKDIETVSKLTVDELEAIFNDSSLPAGKGGARELVSKLEIAEEAKDGSGRKLYVNWISGIAASLLLMLGVGLALQQSRAPKDTFDDPMLAYAQVQEVFHKIGSGAQQGKTAVTESGQLISDKMEETINKLSK